MAAFIRENDDAGADREGKDCEPRDSLHTLPSRVVARTSRAAACCRVVPALVRYC
jgi:hypothetical protein